MNPPFTVAQFLDVFARYNEAVWPAQIALYAAALAMIVLAVRPRPLTSEWIAALLALLWAWMGVVYHWGFFVSINPAAWAFGALFLLETVALAVAGGALHRLSFRARWNASGFAGAAFIVYSVLVYPLLGAAAGHGYPRGPTFGLPCPTTIFTFGMLLWSGRDTPMWVLVVPAVWSIIGTGAAVSLGIAEDYGLAVAGIVGTAVLLRRRGAGATRIERAA